MRDRLSFGICFLLLYFSSLVFLAGCGGGGAPSYSVPGYTEELQGKPFEGGVIIYTPDRYGIWFKDSEGKYFCINGGAKQITGNIPYMPGDVNAYFKAVEE